MPVHDWTRVSAGTFHHFHNQWMGDISDCLNNGLLPADHYALIEQVSGEVVPDVITVHEKGARGSPQGSGTNGGALATLTPPRVRFTASGEMDVYARKQRTLVIRHSSDDSVIALLEIVSPSNKSSQSRFHMFRDKVMSALAQGIHLLLADLHPPGARDPQGIHGALWDDLCGEAYQAPSDKPLTLVAYVAGAPLRAYIEPIAVGDPLPDMPLFLDPDLYVNVPLEATYQSAWRGVPRRWRDVLEPKLS